MFTSRFLTAALVGGLALTTAACDSTEPPTDPGDQELITQVVVTMTNTANASDVRTITATDADGDGADLIFSPASVTLMPGATYDAILEINDTVNDASITEEIEEESEEHLFAYAFTPSSAGTVTITDRESDYTTQDENGAGDLPVGLRFRMAVAASATGSGTFNATLFHFDDGAVKSSAAATSDERDIDIDFPVSFAGPMFTATPTR